MHANKPSKIHWQQWDTKSDNLGHGVHFHDVKQTGQNDLIGFIEGFEWLHRPGQGVTVKGFHIKPDTITTAEIIEKMKYRVEYLINQPNDGLPLDGRKINRRISSLGNC